MTDRIDRGKQPWQAIPRAVLRDGKLSAQAKGGLVTLLSHEEGWVRSVIGILMKENAKCGRAMAKAIMKELVGAGYAELVQGRGDAGKFTTAYVVYAESRSTPGTSLSPGSVPRATVSRGPVNQAAVVEPRDGEPLEEDPHNSFEAFWESYPKKVGKGTARKAWSAAVKKAGPQTIITAALSYFGDVRGTEPRFIAHPATWLNGERWTDEAPRRLPPTVPEYVPPPPASEADLAAFAEGIKKWRETS